MVATTTTRLTETIADAIANLILAQPDGTYTGTIDDMLDDSAELRALGVTKRQIMNAITSVRRYPDRYGYSFPHVGGGSSPKRWSIVTSTGAPLDDDHVDLVAFGARVAVRFALGLLTRATGYVARAADRAVPGSIAERELRLAEQSLRMSEMALTNADAAIVQTP